MAGSSVECNFFKLEKPVNYFAHSQKPVLIRTGRAFFVQMPMNFALIEEQA